MPFILFCKIGPIPELGTLATYQITHKNKGSDGRPTRAGAVPAHRRRVHPPPERPSTPSSSLQQPPVPRKSPVPPPNALPSAVATCPLAACAQATGLGGAPLLLNTSRALFFFPIHVSHWALAWNISIKSITKG